MFQDLKFGARMLIRKPAFSVLAIATMALGIGVNTAMFSFFDAVLFKPLDFRNSGELVSVREKYPNGGTSDPSPLAYSEWKSLNTVFSDIAAVGTAGPTNLTGADTPEQIRSQAVSANYFDMLGVRPVLGRTFAVEEEQAGNDQVVILSNRFWRTRFGSSPNVVGQKLTLDQVSYSVAGVLPDDGVFERAQAEVWIPLAIRPSQMRRNTQFFEAWARLKPGVTLSQANSEMQRLAAALEKSTADFPKGQSVVVEPLRERLIPKQVRQAVAVIMGAVLFILLIATVNVANLMLVQGSSRRRELLVRVAIGASKGRLVRQLLAESVLLATIAGGVGVWLGAALKNVLVTIAPVGTLPREAAFVVDYRVLLFTLAISITTGILFGLVPAWHATRINISAALQDQAAGIATRPGQLQSRLLLIAQIALTFVLVVGATLMIRSFARLVSVDPGFRADHILTFKTTLGPKYPEPGRAVIYQNALLDRIRVLPGVKAAAATSTLPLSDGERKNDFILLSPPRGTIPRTNAQIRAVHRDYFTTIGTPLLNGRIFSENDAERQMIVTQTFAKTFFGSESPLGQQIALPTVLSTNPLKLGRSDPYTIVGIVGDVHHTGLSTPVLSEIYMPLAQTGFYYGFIGRQMTFVVRTDADPADIAGTVQSLAAQIDREQPLFAIKTMEDVIADSVAQPRLATFLFGLFGMLALLLAVVGVYGVMSYTATQRTREIGIRMALGAKPGNIFKAVIGQGAILTLIGTALGCAGALGLTRILQSQLFGITPTDVTTFALTTILIESVALLACFLPARRAMKVDPLKAIRYE